VVDFPRILTPQGFVVSRRFEADVQNCETSDTLHPEMERGIARPGDRQYYSPRLADDALFDTRDRINMFRG
jgi:hypothetical protein